MAEHILNERPVKENSSERESTKVPHAGGGENELGPLYETITINLHKVDTFDSADDAAMCTRIARVAADKFREFRNQEKNLAVAMQCEKLFDVEALMHGAHDVSDAAGERKAMLAEAMQAADRATDILSASPAWRADDLGTPPADRPSTSHITAPSTAEPWRVEIAERAAWEIEAIANLVEERLRGGVADQEELALRALMRRAGQLAGAQMSALSDHLSTQDDVTTIVDHG